MFKYPAYNQVYNALPEDCLSDKPDLAECVFGLISSKSLKGRVQFGHAWALGNPIPMDEKKMVLSSPNPSYYPLYLGNGQTWNSGKIKLAGWKRYPTRESLLDSPKGTEEMESCVAPLPRDTEFIEKIHFHNLRRVELGAVLSALLYNGEDHCYHNLGYGKPLGFGKIKIEVLNMERNAIAELMEEFVDEMKKRFIGWSDSLVELFAMSRGIPKDRESEFVYMNMDIKREKNEFLKGKDAYAGGEQLGRFTQVLNRNVPRAQYIGNVQAAMERVNIEKNEKLRKERKGKYNDLLDKAKDKFNENIFEEALLLLTEAEQYTVSNQEIVELRFEINNRQEEYKQMLFNKEQQAHALQEKKEKVSGGLAKQLDEKYELGPNVGKYKVTTFKVCQNKVSSWLKAAEVEMVPQEQYDALHDTLCRLALNPDKKELKAWGDEKGNIWKTISGWVGPDLASRWFSEIINK